MPIGVSPDGTNINAGCGSTHLATLQEATVAHGADIGIALDGDADRVLVCDEAGTIVDGDQIMGLIAQDWHQTGRLKGGGVVATVMSNLGLERFMNGMGLDLKRTRVGDRYVAEAMRAEQYNLGGEQSGHLIFDDYATTGDGLIAALQILAVLVSGDKPASAMFNLFTPVPQLLKNVRFNGGAPLEAETVKAAIRAGEQRLGNNGRVLIRKSGTEPLIRVMAEGDDLVLVEAVVDGICDAISKQA